MKKPGTSATVSVPSTTSGRPTRPNGSPWPRRSSTASAPPSCSVGPSAAPIASPVSSRGSASPRRPSTATGPRASANGPSSRSTTAGSQALVATDVAARGIHVDNVAGVIHFDPPADHKDYVHRSGRTARAGNEGVVVSLVVPELRSAVATLQRQLKLPVGVHAADTSKLAEGAPRPVRAEQPVRSHEHNAERARGDRNPGPKKSRNRNRNGAAVRSNGNGSHNGNSNGRSSNGSFGFERIRLERIRRQRIERRRPPAFHDVQAVERPGQSPSPEPSGGQGLLTHSATSDRGRGAIALGPPQRWTGRDLRV